MHFLSKPEEILYFSMFQLFSMLANYLQKNTFRPQLLQEVPDEKLGSIVVIPAHDELSLKQTLNSLANCASPAEMVEVILVFNAAENDDTTIKQTNEKAIEEVIQWQAELKPFFKTFVIKEHELPPKHAGVGLARKIGMDEAVRRFEKVNNENGVIICFDADSQCESNYLTAISNHFKKNETTAACSIHFEHPLEGHEFEKEVYEGIYWYESHLRYYKNGLKYANLPFTFHTIGSSMAVRVKDYCKQGGMNRRKAGEDFYFLQKFIDVGVLSELKRTTVIPSPRASHRVPFGTGRAIQEMLDHEREITHSYAFEVFEVLKQSFEKVEEWFDAEPKFSHYLCEFLGEETLTTKWKEIKIQSTSKERFVKRFFQWFNAFQTLKFVHFLRDNHFPLKPLKETMPLLLNKMKVERVQEEDLLLKFRQLDR